MAIRTEGAPWANSGSYRSIQWGMGGDRPTGSGRRMFGWLTIGGADFSRDSLND